MTRAFIVSAAALGLFALAERVWPRREVPACPPAAAPPVCPVCAPAPVAAVAPVSERRNDFTPRSVRIERGALVSPTVIDFERDTRGEPVRAGQVLDDLYAPYGVRLRSSVEGSPIVADDYVVASGSRHWSAATRTPRWTGETEIRFDPPVMAAGFYVAQVSVGGTGLQAYDADGELLGVIFTDQENDDFLGLRSIGAPIHRLRVFPVPHIDPNFTIDDLAFERRGAEPY